MAGLFDDEGDSTCVSSATPRRLMRRTRPHLLEVELGPPEVRGLRLELESDSLILGRGSDAELYLDAEQLSRHHLRFTRRNGEYTCTDLDSRNGLYLNGLRVHSVVLRDGDELQLGDVTLVYREGG
jgi:pSer/pThr/pTyr-binding forkhead associated (FHA) protein